MSRPRLRTLLTYAAAGGLAAGLLLPGAANGAAAQKFTDHFVELFCDGLEGDAGTVFFGITVSPVAGAFAGIEAWPPGAEPFVDPPSFVDDPDQ